MSSSALFVALAFAFPVVPQDTDADDPVVKLGHSAHGESFDEGPRQKPWKLEDVGSTHFPITTSVPEVQEWFDQGNTLLHSFWYYEAERSFRWCLKLDPDCAMAYWGLARSTGRGVNDRARDFLEEAVKRKDTVTERERMYIEAWENAYAPQLSGAIELMDEERGGSEKLAEELEMICIAYPGDVEAKALHMLYSLYDSSRLGNELIAQAIFRAEPFHPGAHHYRIHNWDGPEGAQALSSCEVYGQLASYIGHANHMPGHIYSGIGMWHEGAIWMDRATRVEKRYMQEQLVFPFNHWNYAHNRNYLSYIQEQLGMFAAAQDGARQLLGAPLDPKYNKKDGGFNVFGQGMTALRRGLVKFERWDDILAEGSIPWRETKEDEVWRAYMESLAHLYLGLGGDAIDSMIALKELQKDLPDSERGAKRFIDRMLLEVRGVRALIEGEAIEGTNLLETAAAAQLDSYHRENDPPSYPRVISNVLGEAYLDRGAPELAAACFERTLETVTNDGFALSGLVDAYARLGEREKATEAWGRLIFVWSDADAGLRWMERAEAYGLQSDPIDQSPKEQRNYASQVLTAMGPQTWKPYAAPELEALDPDNNEVTLDEYLGQNVVVVFYIGEQCAHCVDQLNAIDERMDEFEERNVQVLAISGDSPEKNQTSLKMGELGFRLLSDPEFENAHRWRSYDDFEEIELHSTNFVDAEGNVRWARTGGEPFMDLDFLLAEIDRVNESMPAVAAVEASADAGGSK
jgi:peroxiredoxin/tetratricopeptide (TPR) repeat protein